MFYLIVLSILLNNIAAEFEDTFKVKVDLNKVHLESDDNFVVYNKEKTYARCDQIKGTVHIRESWWNDQNIWVKRKVLFHELGHCVLNINHPQSNKERSIMDIKLDTVKKDGSNWSALIKEMKKRVANKKKNGHN